MPHSYVSQDYFSVQDASVSFNPDSAELVYKDGTKFNIEMHDRLYYLSTFNNLRIENNSNNTETHMYTFLKCT